MRPVVLDTDVSSQALKNRLTGPLATRLIGATWCVTVAELWQWAEVRNQRRRPAPRTLTPVNDSWIAAACIANDVPLATLNTKDFAGFAEHDGLVLLAVLTTLHMHPACW